jgi:hypothetical protein
MGVFDNKGGCITVSTKRYVGIFYISCSILPFKNEIIFFKCLYQEKHERAHIKFINFCLKELEKGKQRNPK